MDTGGPGREGPRSWQGRGNPGERAEGNRRPRGEGVWWQADWRGMRESWEEAVVEVQGEREGGRAQLT